MVQWLRLSAFTAMGLGSIPAWGTEIPKAMWCSQKKKKELFKKLWNTLPKQGNKAMKVVAKQSSLKINY